MPRVYLSPPHITGREAELLCPPFLASRRISPNRWWRKAIERLIVSRMDGNQLPLQMGREFRYLGSIRLQHSLDFVAISTALGGFA